MYINKSQIVITVGLLLTLLVAVVSAQERKSEAAITAPFLQYQGRLTDPTSGDELPDGSYTMVFRLYSAATAGTPLWTESKDVPVQGGLFSTVLGSITPLDLGIFNGQALWLGVKVGTDEETVPRQQVMPVAYALSLVPGAEIQAESSSAALNVSNVGSGPALNVEGDLTVTGSLSGGVHNHAAADISSGTLAEPRIPSTIARDSEAAGFVSDHAADAGAHHTRYTDEEAVNAAVNSSEIVDGYWMGLHTADSSSHHPRFTNTEAVNAIKAADGSGSGLDADLLDGQHAGNFAAADHDHSMLPIAYGLVGSEGNVEYTKGVESAYWNGHHYKISLENRTCTAFSCTTIVTPIGDNLIASADGDEVALTFRSTGQYTKGSFYFVTFGVYYIPK